MNLPRGNHPLQRQSHSAFALALLLLFAYTTPAPADIFRWDNGQLIPGTDRITPGPAIDLSHWNRPSHELSFAEFAGVDLRESTFQFSWLDNARFNAAHLTTANLYGARVVNVDFTDALIAEARLGETTARGFTKEQLYSTASYKAKDMHGLALGSTHGSFGPHNDLSHWDFREQNLRGADFGSCILVNTNFEQAILKSANLYLTVMTNANLRGADLSGVYFRYSDITNADVSNATLNDIDFNDTVFNRANFTNASIEGVLFGKDATAHGLTNEQIYSTASYKAKSLRRVNLGMNDLSGWDFSGQDLTSAILYYSNLTNANLAGANLADALVHESSLVNADLTNAVIKGASLAHSGLTKSQLYSTSSYRTRQLAGVQLALNYMVGVELSDQDLQNSSFNYTDLTDANFSDADLSRGHLESAVLSNVRLTRAKLTNANLKSATLTNADFTGAVLAGAEFDDTTTRGFTKEQLYSTASYQARNLQRINLARNDLSGWDFSGQDMAGAAFDDTTEHGFIKEQLYSTANYQQKNLRGVGLGRNDLSGWSFRHQDLTDASFYASNLANADLTGANVEGAIFEFMSGNKFAKEQLYSTASYQSKNLQRISLGVSDLTGWNFAGQDLTNARPYQATLIDADLTGALIRNAMLWGTVERGFTKEQLYSTASYQAKNLGSLRFSHDNLSAWNFSGQNLAGSSFHFCNLTNADFTGANLQGADLYETTLKNADLSGADLRHIKTLFIGSYIGRNIIGIDGRLYNPGLAFGDVLVIRDDDGYTGPGLEIKEEPRPVHVVQEMTVSTGGTLRLLFEADPWDSTISFQPNIPVTLGGELELAFAAGVDPATQIGRTFDLFDWTGVNPTGAFNVVSDYSWDTSRLYTTGEVTLIPEPATLALLLAAAALLALAARSLCRR